MVLPTTIIRTSSKITRAFLELINVCGVPRHKIATTAGFHSNNFNVWSSGKALPNIVNLETALWTLGYELVIRPIAAADEEDPFAQLPPVDPEKEAA